MGLLVLAATQARAERTAPGAPRGKDIEVEVVRGGSVRVPLRGFERNLNPLVYRPLARPRHGTISGLRQHAGPGRQGAGEITYTHGNDDDSTTDTFSFEVRSPLTKLSGRGRVTIRIVDAAAQLRITPPVLDFGEVALGDPPSRAAVELENSGGGVLQGHLEPPAPFLLEDDGAFVLRRGERTRIPILFAPEAPGPFVFRIQPVPGDPAVLTLRGEARNPLSVEVTDPRFALQTDGSRTARVLVRNLSGQVRNISAALPPESPVEAPAAVELAPDEAAEIILRIPPGMKTALPPFGVRFEGAGQTRVHEFSAPAVPAELAMAEAPDFGEVAVGTAARADLVLRNEGGAPAEVRLAEDDALTAARGGPSITIPPGGEARVPLKLKAKKGAPLPSHLTVSFEGKLIQVPIKAILAAAPAPATESRPKSLVASAGADDPQPRSPAVPAETAAPGPQTLCAAVVVEAARDNALVRVAFAPELGIRGFRMERGAMVSAIDPASGIPQTPVFRTIEPPGAEIETLGVTEAEAGGRTFTVCTARLGGLPAGARTYWRMVPSGPSGDLAPTAVIRVDTAPPPAFPWRTVLLAALGVLLAGVLWLRRQGRRVAQ